MTYAVTMVLLFQMPMGGQSLFRSASLATEPEPFTEERAAFQHASEDRARITGISCGGQTGGGVTQAGAQSGWRAIGSPA